MSNEFVARKGLLVPTGNVGIGTNSPAEILHLQSTQPVIRYTKTGVLNWKAGIITGNDYGIAIDNVATTAFTIQSGTGNVGIGTTSPTRKLDINGDVALSKDGETIFVNDQRGTDSISIRGASNVNFQTFATSSYVERMRISSSGNVGIGTSTPGRTLHILGQSGIGTVLKLEGASGTTTYLQLAYNGATNAQSGYIGYDSSANMPFFTSNTERMRITSGGNVGIGTTSPISTLHVAGTFRTELTSGIGGQTLISAINGVSNGYLINIDASNNITHTWHTGGNAPSLFIGSSGNVGIGTTSPSYQLQLSTDSAAKPSTNTWTIASDSRVKENINPYTKGLDVIMQINPVTYDYNGKAGFAKIKDNVGVIAQEIKDVLPEGISTYFAKLNENDVEDTELFNFNSHALTYVLINAIKEQQTQIQLLQQEIETLKNK